MMQGNRARMFRSFGIAGLICCAAALSPAAAMAGYTAAHVDSTQANSEPVYPDSARAAGEEGAILVDVLVHSSGRPGSYRVSQSSGYGDLDAAAVQTVLNWKYVPAMRDGDAVTDWATVRIVYKLPQTAEQSPAPSR